MKNILLKPLAIAVLVAGFGLVSTPASADFLDFTVDEGTVPGVTNDPFTADKINGAYSERITFDGLGGFETHAYANFGLYLSDEGTVTVSESVLNADYGLYALFSSDGTVTALGGGLFQFDGDDGEVTVYIDPNNDTTFALGATGSDSVSRGNTGDDYEIMFSNTMSSATGILVTGVGGFFDLWFENIDLNADGQAYWPDLPVFGLKANVDGDFDTFTVAGTQTLTGDVSVVFTPEPATLALFGMSLLGTGVAARRRRRS